MDFRNIWSVVRFVPGLLGAIVAYLVLKLVSWAASLPLEFVLFLATYAGVAVSVDMAMNRYGRSSG